MHVSDIEMRDDELLKAGRSSSIGSGSGSGKQGLKSNCSSQAAAPKDLKMGLAVLALPQVGNFWPLTFTPGLIPSWCAGGGYRKINWLLITIFQFNKFTRGLGVPGSGICSALPEGAAALLQLPAQCSRCEIKSKRKF